MKQETEKLIKFKENKTADCFLIAFNNTVDKLHR